MRCCIGTEEDIAMTPFDPYGDHFKPRKPGKGGGNPRDRGQPQHTQAQAQHRPPGGQPNPAAPPREKIEFIDSETGAIRRELVENNARQWATDFLNGDPKLSSHQLRRFYGEVKSLRERVRAFGFQKTLPLIRILKSKVAYACPKTRDSKVKKVPDEFRTYIETMVDSVGESEANFEAFVLCFEAVVGYFYGEGGK